MDYMKDEIIDRLEDCDDYRVLVEVANIMDCHYTMLIEEIEDCRNESKLEEVLQVLRNYD